MENVVSIRLLRLLFGAAAALQEARGQHLPRQPRGWAGQVEYGEADVLLAKLPREAGSDWRVSVPEGDQGHQP